MAKLPRASPSTVIRKDRRATVSKYNQTPFCILSNPAYGDLSEGLPNRFPTLSIYLPHADNAMRLKINAAMKYGDAEYFKASPGAVPEKNFLADNGLLLAGKPFKEFAWQKDEKYLKGLPDGTHGCMQATCFNIEHAKMMIADLGPIIESVGMHCTCTPRPGPFC